MTNHAFGEFSNDELSQRIIRLIFEANIVIRAANLRGIPVHLDFVERKRPGHPKPCPEIVCRAGERTTS